MRRYLQVLAFALTFGSIPLASQANEGEVDQCDAFDNWVGYIISHKDRGSSRDFLKAKIMYYFRSLENLSISPDGLSKNLIVFSEALGLMVDHIYDSELISNKNMEIASSLFCLVYYDSMLSEGVMGD